MPGLVKLFLETVSQHFTFSLGSLKNIVPMFVHFQSAQKQWTKLLIIFDSNNRFSSKLFTPQPYIHLPNIKRTWEVLWVLIVACHAHIGQHPDHLSIWTREERTLCAYWSTVFFNGTSSTFMRTYGEPFQTKKKNVFYKWWSSGWRR